MVPEKIFPENIYNKLKPPDKNNQEALLYKTMENYNKNKTISFLSSYMYKNNNITYYTIDFVA